VSTWNGASLRMESWNLPNAEFGVASIDSVSIELRLPPYEKWAIDNLLTGSDALRIADPDEDGMENLLEYALGGNPNVDDAGVVLPTSDVVTVTGTNWLEYAYNRRLDSVARGLGYDVVLKNDLVTGVWSNIGTSAEISAVALDGYFETVTNRISTAEAVKFVNLEVTEN